MKSPIFETWSSKRDNRELEELVIKDKKIGMIELIFAVERLHSCPIIGMKFYEVKEQRHYLIGSIETTFNENNVAKATKRQAILAGHEIIGFKLNKNWGCSSKGFRDFSFITWGHPSRSITEEEEKLLTTDQQLRKAKSIGMMAAILFPLTTLLLAAIVYIYVWRFATVLVIEALIQTLPWICIVVGCRKCFKPDGCE